MALTLLPNNGQSLNATRDNIRNNFAITDSGFKVNHYNFGEANAGKHLYLQMPEVAAPATAANEAALYSKEGVASHVTELFFRRESSGAEIPFTEALLGNPGWTYIPSGIMIQWGIAANINETGVVIGFPRNFPTACCGVVFTSNNNSSSNHFVSYTNANVGGFTGWSTTRSGGADTSSPFFIAIGY